MRAGAGGWKNPHDKIGASLKRWVVCSYV